MHQFNFNAATKVASKFFTFILFSFFALGIFAQEGIIDHTEFEISILVDESIIAQSDKPFGYKIQLKNIGEKSFDEVNFIGEVETWRLRNKISDIFTADHNMDPNSNGILEPNETWTYHTQQTFSYETTKSYILKTAVFASSGKQEYIDVSAIMVHGIGTNMDVSTDVSEVEAGTSIEVNLITRLLIDEDAAKDPGSIIIAGIPFPLPATQWEARDLLILENSMNNGELFDPFNQPAGVDLTNFCIQGADAGRNSNNILDECEPIDSFRDPCTAFGEDDELCEFPDWHFCYNLTIPANYTDPTYTIMAADSFVIWTANEFPAGSGNFNPFMDNSANIVTYREDELTIDVTPATACNIPPELDMTVNLTGVLTQVYWHEVPGADRYRIQFRPTGTTDWNLNTSTNLTNIMTNLIPSTQYDLRFASRCNGWGDYGPIHNFTTSGCIEPDTDFTEVLNGTAQRVVLVAVDDAKRYQVRYRRVGQSGFTTLNYTGGNLSRNLLGLIPDTEYEFNKRTQCNSNRWTPWTDDEFFTTIDCGPPDPVNVTFPDEGEALVEWTAEEDATNYQIRYRIQGDLNWITRSSQNTNRLLTDLLSDQTYIFQMRARCPSWTPWSSNNVFTTPASAQGEATISSRSSIDTELMIYPNPSSDIIYLQIDNVDLSESNLTILDMNGQAVMTQRSVANGISVDALPAGQYMARLKTTSKTYTERFIIIK